GPDCSWCRVLNHAFGDIGCQQGIQGALDVGRAAQDVVGLQPGNDRPDRVQGGLAGERATEVLTGPPQADHLDRQAGLPRPRVPGTSAVPRRMLSACSRGMTGLIASRWAWPGIGRLKS